jgi:hypothetical protein
MDGRRTPGRRTIRRHAAWLAATVLVLAGCGGGGGSGAPSGRSPAPRGLPVPPPLPDEGGWGIPVLALEQTAGGALWAGTNGQGIWVLRERTAPEAAADSAARQADSIPGAVPSAPRSPWVRFAASGDDATSISWDVVNGLAVTADGTIWYGTVGNGFGRSTDGGSTWRNWTFEELGPRWLYTAHNGVRAVGDTVYIATTDGLRITRDGGTRWTCVVARGQTAASPQGRGGCDERVEGLPSVYLLALAVDGFGRIWAGGIGGLSVSRDGGRTWQTATESEGLPAERVRAVAMNTDSTTWVATETRIYVDSARRGDRFAFKEANVRTPGFARLPGAVRAIVPSPGRLPPTFALSYGMAAGEGETGGFRLYYLSAADRYRPAGDLWTVVWRGPPLWPVGGATTGLNVTLAGDFATQDAVGAVRASETNSPTRPWLRRPIEAEGANPHVDATWLYGSTMGGNLEENPGVAFNNPEGTAVLAVADGEVVWAGEAGQGSRTVAIRHDRSADGRTVFSTYAFNSEVEAAVGDRVRAGQRIARVGRTGRARNSQLRLGVHASPADDVSQIVNPDEPVAAHTVNPQLWIEPMPGTGVVAGRVLDGAGRPVAGARIHGLVLPYPSETPFAWVETYGAQANADPLYGENFGVGDVPAGDYLLGVEIGDERVWRRVRVQAGRVSFVEFRPGS